MSLGLALIQATQAASKIKLTAPQVVSHFLAVSSLESKGLFRLMATSFAANGADYETQLQVGDRVAINGQAQLLGVRVFGLVHAISRTLIASLIDFASVCA